MCSNIHPEDSQELRNAEDEHREVRAILRRRQQHGASTTYRVLAGSAGSAALVMWGFIAANAAVNPAGHVGRAYAAFLALAVVVGVAAIAAVFTWLRERDGSRRSAEADRIREYQHGRQVRAIQAAVAAALLPGRADGDEGGLDSEVIELGRRLSQKVHGVQSPGWNRAR